MIRAVWLASLIPALLATGLAAQELKIQGSTRFAPGQFVSISFVIDADEQPLLLLVEPEDLQHAMHKSDGKLSFYTAMPKDPVVMWVLLQKAVNGGIQTKRHKVVLTPSLTPEPDPTPNISEGASVYLAKILQLKEIDKKNCGKIAKIFKDRKDIDQSVQKLIDSTFTEIQDVISTDVQKRAWKPFFDWLEKHLSSLDLDVEQKDEWKQQWSFLEEAFDAVR